MNQFRIKNFSTIVSDSEVLPSNADGSFKEATTNFFKTDDIVYILNPSTLLASEISGFLPKYWDSYSFNWIDVSYPGPVLNHISNHFRAVAIRSLLKKGSSIENIKNVVGISAGYPFSIFSGTCSVNTTGGYHTIVQTLADATTVTYKIPDTYTLSISDGDSIDHYTVLVEGVTLYDFKDTNWLSTFDSGNILPSSNVNNLDFYINKNRIVGIETYGYFGFNSVFLEKTLNKIIPNNIILLFKMRE